MTFFRKTHIIVSHFTCAAEAMTVSTENAASPKSTIPRNSNFSVQIQIKPKSQFEFVLRDTEESEFLDMVDFWEAAFSVETVISFAAHLK